MKRVVPVPREKYDRELMTQAFRVFSLEFGETYTKGQDLEIPDARLILKSPNGTRWSITVSNSGVISATSL